MDEYGSISYEKDIVPLQRQFFSGLASNPKISREALSSISNSYSDKINAAYMQQAKLAEADQMLKTRALSYETTKLQLEGAREDATRKRNMFAGLSQIQSELTSIAADPNRDNAQKKQAFGIMGIKLAGEAALNPAIANALNAANSSLTTQQKDRVTKLDYFNAGANPDTLASYEKSIGRSLAANEDVPIDVYGTGLYTAKTGEIDRRVNVEAEKDRQERLGKVFDFVSKAKPKENKMTGMSTDYEDPISKNAVASVVQEFGTPDEITKFGKANVNDQIGIGQSIVSDIYLGKRAAVSPRQTKKSFGSLFAPTK
jgi:hypothetical protein